MAILIEGVVEDGRIRVIDDIVLPESAKVYIVVPDAAKTTPARIYSPRFVNPEHAADFRKQVLEIAPNDEV